ncbi:hypothetical protein GH733_008831 [Mirounga leonina]|nr:hypothetical protein GH733_008831 [Mirounga leonina]
MEENLTQVDGTLGHLKNNAPGMGNEVEAPDGQIEQITEKADVNKDGIESANARARKGNRKKLDAFRIASHYSPFRSTGATEVTSPKALNNHEIVSPDDPGLQQSFLQVTGLWTGLSKDQEEVKCAAARRVREKLKPSGENLKLNVSLTKLQIACPSSHGH